MARLVELGIVGIHLTAPVVLNGLVRGIVGILLVSRVISTSTATTTTT